VRRRPQSTIFSRMFADVIRPRQRAMGATTWARPESARADSIITRWLRGAEPRLFAPPREAIVNWQAGGEPKTAYTAVRNRRCQSTKLS
jgi:hypothetical protein